LGRLQSARRRRKHWRLDRHPGRFGHDPEDAVSGVLALDCDRVTAAKARIGRPNESEPLTHCNNPINSLTTKSFVAKT
jgi:hypothetical protein